MTGHPPLPPHLERFVREQVAGGCFPSEGEVVRAALRLLQAAGPADTNPEPGGDAAGSSGRLARTALSERWESPAEWRAHAATADTPPARPRRSPRGLLAGLGSDLGYADLTAARAEAWDGHRPGDAR